MRRRRRCTSRGALHGDLHVPVEGGQGGGRGGRLGSSPDCNAGHRRRPWRRGAEGRGGGGGGGRTVAQLRPAACPLLRRGGCTAAAAAAAMAAARVDLALVLEPEGEGGAAAAVGGGGGGGRLAGVLTAKDITRRLVAKGLSDTLTDVEKIMTPNPICVSLQDSAIESLTMMVENHFQHLPVLDSSDAPVGFIGVAKCLYDAIRRLEKAEAARGPSGGGGGLGGRGAAAVVEAAAAAAARGGRSSAALRALLQKITSADGNNKTTLGSLAETKARASVTPDQTVSEAAAAMTRANAGCLVVGADGRLKGILTFKDVANRVVANGLDPTTTPVQDVMTPSPDTFPPSLDLVEALHVIRESRFQHLPVAAPSTGEVLGLVDVMDVVEATIGGEAGAAGAAGWGGLLAQADAADDVSVTSSLTAGGSVRTYRSSGVVAASSRAGAPTDDGRGGSSSASASAAAAAAPARPVKRLRPRPPALAQVGATLREAARAMTAKRQDAALLLDKGRLAGILTSTDVARALAAGRDLGAAPAAEAMTADPLFVSAEDPALEALALMVERRFRHLPVVDAKGDLSGIIDIAKCLYDAISRMEEVAGGGGGGRGKKKAEAARLMASSMQKMKKGNRSVEHLLGLVNKIFGGNPTLEELLAKKEKPKFATLDASIQEVADIMVKTKSAVLVVDDAGGLAGLVTPRDLLDRAAAPGLDPRAAAAAAVMTPDPETVPGSTELVAALHEMHEKRYQHLPVVGDGASSSGALLGVVDVQDILSATMGGEGRAGWRALFGADDADDGRSDRSASRSGRSAAGSSVARGPAGRGAAAAAAARAAAAAADAGRAVARLRPRPPVLLGPDATVEAAARAMAAKRADACLLADPRGGHLLGILTDTDVLRRVLARGLPAGRTAARGAATADPQCVRADASAVDALGTMVERRFRHLPVVDDQGAIVGVLDIAKCLYDAVSRMDALEARASGGDAGKKKKGGGLDKAAAAKQMAGAIAQAQSAEAVQAMVAAMQALFAAADEEAAAPTLGALLERRAAAGHAAPLVAPALGLPEAAERMAAARGAAAAAVDEAGRLVGILTPKDLLNRVVAKGLDPAGATVAAAMTPAPDAFPPGLDLPGALRELHAHRYLHLPVADPATGRCLGVVDVMDVMTATAGDAGKEGWQTFFGAALDAGGDDSASEAGSLGSKGGGSVATGRTGRGAPPPEAPKDRPVSQLRPAAAAVGRPEDTVAEVARGMAKRRSDVALVVDAEGHLAGIFTANDLVRRVVAGAAAAATTAVGAVHTPDPLCVQEGDGALAALRTMARRRFQHLPVLDAAGGVVGVLDVAKCLYDAVGRLERAAARARREGAAAAAALAERLGGGGGAGDDRLLAGLMAEAFGAGLPTAGDVLKEKQAGLGGGGAAAFFVAPADSVAAAAGKMAAARTAVLVVGADGRLAGILTPKDVLNRVVAPGLDPAATPAAEAMTPEPDAFPPDLDLVDAMHQMHDHRYLHLPIADPATGEVLGLIDVMDVVCASMGGGEDDGGAEGWASLFRASLDADVSDAASARSSAGAAAARRRGGPTAAARPPRPPSRRRRPVGRLRLARAARAAPGDAVAAAAAAMARGRTGVALVRRGGGDAAGPAEGIFTDSDLARRVLAQYLDPEETEVSKVMTPEPEHVRLGDPALEALGTMARRGFRHLPVLDDQGRVAGVLDIARCLHDAVAVLEKLQGALDGGDPTAHPLARRFLEGVAPGEDVPAELRALLAPLVRSLLPTVGDLVQGQDPAARAVRPQDNAREAAARLAAGGGGGGGGGGGVRAVLVLEEGGRLAGVVTPELLLRKVVAKKLSPDFTACASVMDARPEVAAPGDSLLDALRRMHSYKCHDLPVVDEDSGRVLGAVNVLDVVKQAFGGDGDLDAWAWIINSDLDFFEDEAGGAPGGGGGGGSDADGLLASESPDLLPELPRVVVPGALRSPDPERDTMISDLSQDMGGFSVAGGESFAFKVTDAAGHMHRITAAADNLAGLTRAVAAKLAAEADAVVLKYTDDEGDEVAITCQQSLREAVNHAREAGNKALRLKVVIEEKQSPKKAAAVTSFTSAEADEKPGTGESTGVLSADAAVKPPPEAGRGEAVVAAPAVGKAAEAGAGVEAAAPAVGEGKGGDSKAGGSSALVLVGGLAVVAAAAGVGAMFYLKANKKK